MVKCAQQVLEPIMKLGVFAPEEKVSDVIGDLNRRRGMIQARAVIPCDCFALVFREFRATSSHARFPCPDPCLLRP